MTKFIIIMLSAVFINNYVLSRVLGICPFLGVSKKLNQATGMSLAVIFVMLIATAVTWPIQTYLLDPNNLSYLQTIVFILVIASLVQLVEIILKKYIPSLHKSLGVYLPLITTNCAVLGVTILNIDEGYTFAEAMVNSLGSGLGFFLAQLNVFFRDMEHIYNAVLTAWLYLTPIMYSIDILPSKVLKIAIKGFNPLYYYVAQFRDLVYYGRLPGPRIFFGGWLIALLMLLIGVWSFQRSKDKFILYI